MNQLNNKDDTQQANFLQVVLGSEMCLNGHPITQRTTDNMPWKCGNVACEYYDGHSQQDELDKILSTFGSELYGYITEKDIIKAAEIYSEKPMFREAKAAILNHFRSIEDIEAAIGKDEKLITPENYEKFNKNDTALFYENRARDTRNKLRQSIRRALNLKDN